MNADEVNNLLSVMQKKITELTSQNIMLEAKVMYLTSTINNMNKESSVSDGGSFSDVDESSTKETAKSRRSA
jgi:hypothetical protein